MMGFSSFILRHIGAFVRWAFGGFKQDFELILNDKESDEKLYNDVINIFIGFLLLFSVLLCVGLFCG